MKRIVLIATFLLLNLSLFGEVIDLSPSKTNLDIVYFDKSRISIHVSLDSFERTNQEKSGYSFDNLFVDSWSRLRKEGYPALPSIKKMVMVPKDGKVQVEVTILKNTIYSDVLPYPAQPSAVDNDEFETPPFAFDKTFYSSKATYPQALYSVSDVQTIRGLSFVYLTITPFQYDASKKTLDVIEEFDVDIKIDGEFQFDDRLYSPYLSSVVMNNSINPVYHAPKSSVSKDVDGADLIIVTTYDFMGAAETLKEWKSQKGFYTEIAYLEEIGSTAQNICGYLFMAYEVWALPPSFVIFLGDSDIVPTNYVLSQYSGEYLGTDRVYACMDGDYHPDIAYGRISVDNEQQAFVVIDKIIEYEKNPPTLSSFYNHTVHAGYFQDDEPNGYESRRFIKTSEEMRDFFLSEGYDAERIYVTDSSINPTNYNNGYYANGEPIPDELLRANGFPWNGNETDITNAINTGTFLLSHRDHGLHSGWGDPAYDIGSLSKLSNGDLLPMVFSINCQTAWFDSETDYDSETFECFTEMFLRKENGGAVSTVGACRNSLSGYNDFLALGMIDGMWDNFLPNFGFDTGGYLGNVFYHGLIAMEQLWGGSGSLIKYQFDIFHIIGDPTIQIWREQPQQITATHDASFPFDITSISISTDIDGGIASLVVDGELIGKTEFNTPTFELYLSDSLSSPQVGVITISARDKKPYVGNITFVPINGSYVVIDSFFISDMNGNNDGEWDAGEEVTLTYNLTNIGNEDVDTVYVRLDSDEVYFQIYQPMIVVTGLQPNESTIYSTEALISMNCENGQKILLHAIADNEGSEFIDTQDISVVKIPKISIPIDSIYYEVSGHVNTSIPFEIQNIGADTLRCTLLNHSHQCADLTAANSYLTIPHVSEFEGLSELTLMMWLKVNDIVQPCFILNKGLITGDFSFAISMTNSSTLLYKFKNASGTDFQKVLNLNVNTNDWFNVAIVVNGSSVESYINGELLSSDDFTSPIYTTTSDILVGAYVNSLYEFQGCIDELAIYTSALSQNEIQDKFCSIIRDESSNLLSYYRFDNNTQLQDFTGHNNAVQQGTVNFNSAGAPVTTWYGFDCSEFVVEPYHTETIDITFNTFGYVPQLFSSHMGILSNTNSMSDILIPIDLLYEACGIDNSEQNKSLCLYYSNPFSPSDQMQFSIKTIQHVSLDIYNIKGQYVTNLVDEVLLPQQYSYQWNGRDHYGKYIENGVYFIRIQSGNNVQVKRMIFLR